MKFGSREICDVVFKAAAEGQKVGTRTFHQYQPVFMIDTARTSTIEQATSTVYAQGGKGYNRLIAWEGEKTVTYTVEDALISPQGLAVLTGAGVAVAKTADASSAQHVHVVLQGVTDSTTGAATFKLVDLQDELGVTDDTFYVCTNTTVPIYGTVLDGSGAGIEFIDTVTTNAESGAQFVEVDSTHDLVLTAESAKGKTVAFDFYVIMRNGVTEITIRPESLGGYFYVEGDTLYRREDNGKDMAATITFPKVKVQSAFTLSMSASGDPSTFSFVMDAMPAYTRFDHSHKTVCNIQIVGDDSGVTESTPADHTHSF